MRLARPRPVRAPPIGSAVPQLWEAQRSGQKPPEAFGANRDWNIDLVPKFIIANGKLVHALMHTGVTRYMDFRAVEGSYVLKKDKVRKVPATDAEALTSDLLGFFEKRRVHSFFSCAPSPALRDAPRRSKQTEKNKKIQHKRGVAAGTCSSTTRPSPRRTRTTTSS